MFFQNVNAEHVNCMNITCEVGEPVNTAAMHLLTTK